MKTYKIVMRDNRGSRAIEAMAATCLGTWRNCVNKYDGMNDLGFIDVSDDNSEYLELMLEADENVVSYRVE